MESPHSTCNQSAPFSIVVEQSAPRAAKSAERIEGAMMAGGDIVEMRRGREIGDVKQQVAIESVERKLSAKAERSFLSVWWDA